MTEPSAGLRGALGGDLLGVLDLAALAPSVHNTQPWSFTWDGTTLRLHEDLARALPVLDGSGRERLLSCGAAVLHARLAFAALGYDVETQVLPDAERPDLVAALAVRGRRAATTEEQELAAAIPKRATERDAFDDEQVDDTATAALQQAAEQEGAWLRRVDHGPAGSDAVLELQVLLSAADGAQREDPRYLAELATWRRTSTTGVADRALATVPAEDRAPTWVGRDFDAAGPARPAGGASGPPPAEHPVVLVLGTTGDLRVDWVTAGQALGRVLLRATVLGLAAQPLTQVLEVPALRARARHALGLVGHPQVVLRVGHGHTAPTSRRRPASASTTLLAPVGDPH